MFVKKEEAKKIVDREFDHEQIPKFFFSTKLIYNDWLYFVNEYKNDCRILTMF